MVWMVPINFNRVISRAGQEFTLNGYLGSRVICIWVGLSSVFTCLVGALGHHLSLNSALSYTLYG